MSTAPKKGFSAFIRSNALVEPAQVVRLPEPPATDTELTPSTPPPAVPAPTSAPERIRQVTATGRVRTHSANRLLPGVTLRLSEERWERLKMLSIQERRPIQDILGEALEGYMKGRGLPW